MNGNVEWSFVFTAVLVIFAFLGLLMEYYYRIYRPREKDKEQKRNGIYKPLLNDVDTLIANVKEKKPYGAPFNWKTVEDRVSTQLYGRLQNLFLEKVDNYYKLLEHNQNFVRFSSYFYLKAHLSELDEEFKNLGVGALEFELYDSMVTPILNGKKITLRELEDKKPELYENLAKCASFKKFKELLCGLNEENPCIESLRKAEQDLLQSAIELKNELKSF